MHVVQKGRIVLEGLLKDDDEVVAVWYLLGWLHYLTKDHPTAKLMLEEVDKVGYASIHIISITVTVLCSYTSSWAVMTPICWITHTSY